MRRPKRILLALQSVAVGGMETHAIDLAGEYVRRGIRVRSVVPEGPELDAVAGRFAANGARVTRLTTDARAGRVGQVVRLGRLARLLISERPQVVHLHTGGATGGLGLLAASRLLTRATVGITEHDVPGEHPGRRQRTARALLDRSAHLVVAVSRRNAALRQERLPVRCRSFAAILNGVPLPTDGPAERAANRARVRAELGIGGDELVFGSLVRLAEGKGLDTLLDAFALAQDAAPSRLLLVGDGPLRDELAARAARLGVAERVVFAGHQPAPAPYLDAMDAFVLAVPAGSMSIALLEAMARGLPPVITFCGPEEAVIDGETGLGARPNDPDDLARALRELACPHRRACLGHAAEAHIREHFSVGRVADDVLEAFAGARAGGLEGRLGVG